MFLDGSALHAGSGQEDIAETAAIISSMADAIMIRSKSQRVIDEVVANSTVPVISGMSCNDFRADGFGSQEQHHPTQVIADLITMIERKPKGKSFPTAPLCGSVTVPMDSTACSWITCPSSPASVFA